MLQMHAWCSTMEWYVCKEYYCTLHRFLQNLLTEIIETYSHTHSKKHVYIFHRLWFFVPGDSSFFFSHCIQLCSDHHKEKKYIHMCDVLLGIISDWVLFVYFTFEVAFFALCHINSVTHSDSFLIIHPEVITLQHDVHRVCNQCLFLVKLVFCVKVHFYWQKQDWFMGNHVQRIGQLMICFEKNIQMCGLSQKK